MTRMHSVSLVRVSRKPEHVGILHGLLLRRTHVISHKSMPTMRQHREFVLSHPYRAWYLIKAGNEYVGTIYLLKNNTIGVSVNKGAEKCFVPAIRLLLLKYKPLPAVKSVRAAEFDFNVSPSNRRLIAILESMGARRTQVTYVLPMGAGETKPTRPPRRQGTSA
jgi:hypothetical protein